MISIASHTNTQPNNPAIAQRQLSNAETRASRAGRIGLKCGDSNNRHDLEG
jgi:hypothetical protein